MHTVHIGISHDDNFTVAEFGYIEVLTDTGTQSRNHRFKLIVAIDTVDSCLFNVEHLAPEGEYRLILTVSALLCRAARRITLDYVYLGIAVITLRAVCQLFGHSSAAEVILLALGFSCTLCSFTGSEG